MEFILLGLMILAFPFIAIVALVKAVGHTDWLLRLKRCSPRSKRVSAAPQS